MQHRAIFANASLLRHIGNMYIVDELKKAGLTGIVPSHGGVLRHLLSTGSCNMGELAREVRRSKPTLTVLVKKLEKEGYVERLPDPRDSRGTLVRLTDRGKALESSFDAISVGLEKLLEKRLSSEEIDSLDRLLAKCVA